MILSLFSVQFAARVQILSLFALVFADLVFAVPTTQLSGRDSIEQQLVVKAARRCSILDEDDVQSLPGWPKVEKFVSDTWGEGSFTLKINPSNYRDKRATMCIVDPIPIHPSGKHNCTSKRIEVPPERNSKVVDVEFGYRNIGYWNITGVSSAAHAELFLGHFKVPEMGFMNLQPIDGQGEFFNAPDNSFTTVASNMTYKQTQLTSVRDQSCTATIQQGVCHIPSAGRIQLAATGYLWITFETARTAIGNPNGGKHRRYAVKIEEVLEDVTDRSVWIDYEGVMTATTRTDYFNECRSKLKE
jgi:hypothetical protein